MKRPVHPDLFSTEVVQNAPPAPPAVSLGKENGIQEDPDGSIRIRFSVPYEYPVCFTRGAWTVSNPLLRDLMLSGSRLVPHPFMVFVDAQVAVAHPHLLSSIRAYAEAASDRLCLAVHPIPVPGGELSKNDADGFQRLMHAILESRLCRHSTIIAIGGGAVLDAVGFAASQAHRGIRLLRMPTTTLAQNDAGIGVKNGLNAGVGKNAIGSFAPPLAVINDLDFLRTLNDRQWIAGAAEAFKVAILKDPSFFRELCENADRLRHRDEAAMESLIRQCARLHLEHIASGGDPFERGSARPLDFGHWSAHRIELLSRFTVSHGEAVSVGIALDSLYAFRSGWLSEAETHSILRGLSACGLPLYSPELEWRDARGARLLYAGLAAFREHLGGKLSVSFPSGIGHLREESTIDLQRMDDCIQLLATRSPAHPA